MTVRIHTLSNGFRVVTEHMPGLGSAALGIWVNAGGRHERVEQNGIAHFLEHMAFKGTARRSPLQIAEVLEDVGGYLNAYTSREATAYYARVLEADVPLALDVISDIVLNPVFDPQEIEVERGVILQEIGQALDTPDDIIFDWLQEAAYPDQAFGRTILGPEARVRGFTRADLAGFVEEHYSPERMILSAAGAVDHDAIVREAEALFGHLTAHGADKAEPAQFIGGELRRIKPLEQVHITLGFEGPGFRDEALYVFNTFNLVMGGGMSSRLFQEAREKRGLCYSIYAHASAHADTGMSTIYAGTSGDDIAGLAELTINELRRAADGFSQAEIDRALAQQKASLLMGQESPSNRAERMARLVATWGRMPTIEESLERIEAVTPQAVRAFAEGLLTSRAALSLYGPADRAPGLEELRARLAA